MAPLESSLTYRDPSGPCANPQGLAFALLGFETLAPFSVPANPFAKISQSPVALPFLKGINATKKPS